MRTIPILRRNVETGIFWQLLLAYPRSLVNKNNGLFVSHKLVMMIICGGGMSVGTFLGEMLIHSRMMTMGTMYLMVVMQV